MPNSNLTYVVKTLGCKANLYDSQLIEAELQKRGWKPFFKERSEGRGPGLCIVNSCTVTDEADRQSRKTAARLSRDNPAARVVVTGCAAEVDPERLAESKGIDYVIGNRNKPELVELILKKVAESSAKESHQDSGIARAEIIGKTQGFSEMLSRHPMDRDWYGEEGFLTPPVHLEGHSAKTRAFLKIQEGCNSFCTYCIIPYGRGPSRSVRPRELIEQIRTLVSQGIREVVITGTNVGDYGTDWSSEETPQSAPLVELFKLVLNETKLERLRVSSLDPVEITPELIVTDAIRAAILSSLSRVVTKCSVANVEDDEEKVWNFRSQALSRVDHKIEISYWWSFCWDGCDYRVSRRDRRGV